MKKNLSKYKEVYNFIVFFYQQHMYPPTYEEIMKGVGISSKATAYSYIHKLKEKGLIVISPTGRIGLTHYSLIMLDNESIIEKALTE